MRTEEIAVVAREYRELKAESKILEEQIEALKQRLIREMDEWQIDRLSVGEYTIHYSLFESTRIDTTRLKAEHPDMYDAYSKSTVSTRFQVS